MSNLEPGIEIKTWFPLATEITARFKESQAILTQDTISIAIICWLPDFIIAGKPYVIDVFVDDALSFARARDNHYHNPPRYLVIEPQDTNTRTSNLQQRNCSGYRLQETDRAKLADAEQIVAGWGDGGRTYTTDRAYQEQLQDLRSRFTYREDTNFGKIDRIGHQDLERFKSAVLSTLWQGERISRWKTILEHIEQGIASPEEMKSLDTFLDPGAMIIS